MKTLTCDRCGDELPIVFGGATLPVLTLTVVQPKTAQGLPQNGKPDAEYHFCRGDCLADWANNTGAV